MGVKQMIVEDESILLATRKSESMFSPIEGVDEAIQHATKIIGAHLKADCYGVMLYDPIRNALCCHSSARGGCGHVDMLPLYAKSIVTKVFKTGQSVRLAKTHSDANYYPIDPAIRAELCVPLKFNGQILGVVNVESKRENAFTYDDENWLIGIAGQLAEAIDCTSSR